MKKILTASQMKEFDRYTIEEIGLPSMVLMERAALCVFGEIREYMLDTNLKPAKTKVLVVCGRGNNGADGLAVARLLYEHGLKVDVVLLGEEGKYSLECEKQLSLLVNMGLSIGAQIKSSEYDIIVDALFGIGLHRPLEGEWLKGIQLLNQMSGYKVAVDISSGLNADTGVIQGEAFVADLTVTFEYLKRGFFLGMGPLVSGKVVCCEIGITHLNLEKAEECFYTFEEQVVELLPYRNPNGNKGTFGKLYVYAGSPSTMGAALLCAKSAFSTGAGMVKILCPKEYEKLFLEQLPEAMLSCYEQHTNKDVLEEMIKRDLNWADVVVAGPGIGTKEMSNDILQILLKYAKVPMILDADALNLLSAKEKLKKDLLYFNHEYQRQVVLTPHVGELSRLLNVSVSDLKNHACDFALQLSEDYDCIAVCKDAKTIVKRKGMPGYLNFSGNHGMATAGSGDVLAGILGAYAALEGDLYRNIQKAVYLHGCAGDRAAKNVGERGMTASHIIEGMMQLQKGM